MKNESIKTLVQSWETIRYELLKTRISDLDLKIEGSPLEPFVRRLYRELEQKRVRFRPTIYLTDSWGCPDRIPVIGVPFYLADKRLARLEEEQAGDVEDSRMIMMLLRHEAGHSLNYAYRLWTRPSWLEIFGPFTKPYRDVFRPHRLSRNYVRHIESYPYGRTYAQKHPDEDFAETFAVWLTPRSGWRRRYRNWPAFRKLIYVDQLMKEIRSRSPENLNERLVRPVAKIAVTLAEHYGKKTDRFRRAARGYVDDRLKEAFPPSSARLLKPASSLFRRYSNKLREQIISWSMLNSSEASSLLRKLEARADVLKLAYSPRKENEVLMDVVSLVIVLATDYAYTGKLVSP